MPRRSANNTEAVNSDSFLDIVASVVSIMIIMVVMEGVRIRNAPVKVDIANHPTNQALQADLVAEQAERREVAKVLDQVRGVQQQTALRKLERDTMASMAAVAEKKIEERRRQLDGAKQAEFDISRKLSESKLQLQQLAQQREQVEQEESAPVVIESYPTPISHAVDGPEAHLLITNGRVVFVPVEPLLTQLQASAKREASRLISESDITETVGPVEGFRLKYTIERHDVAPDPKHGGRGGAYARLQRWTIIPSGNDLGEPVRLALVEDSDFQRALAKILPGRTTITIWVYPDGFEAFRQIRKELYRRGYTIAARPLPPGQQISGSPDGSKSAAQ
jgi:hypothetical protein